MFEYDWNLCYCQDFLSIENEEGGRILILKGASASSSYLKIAFNLGQLLLLMHNETCKTLGQKMHR